MDKPLTPAQKIAAGLSEHGKAWARTTDCYSAYIEAQHDPEQAQKVDEILGAYRVKRVARDGAVQFAQESLRRLTPGLLDNLTEWAARHNANFAPRISGSPRGGWWGWWDLREGCLWVRTQLLRELLQAWGLRPSNAIRELRQQGAVIIRSGRCTAKIRFPDDQGRERSYQAYGLRLVRHRVEGRVAAGVGSAAQKTLDPAVVSPPAGEGLSVNDAADAH